nr:protein-export chaperone SecB [Nitrosomonas nitrosa]
MLPSIIQLAEISFVGVKIWPQPHDNFKEQEDAPFDFNNVEIGEKSEIYVLDNKSDPSSYGVMLRIVIENKSGKIAPYDIDVCVTGHFKISKKVPKEQRENLITVNGCSMLYGAIREQVMTITSRSIHGTLVLPTVNFQDKITENSDTLQDNKSTESARKARVRKSKQQQASQ